jgi:hypothetical protein
VVFCTTPSIIIWCRLIDGRNGGRSGRQVSKIWHQVRWCLGHRRSRKMAGLGHTYSRNRDGCETHIYDIYSSRRGSMRVRVRTIHTQSKESWGESIHAKVSKKHSWCACQNHGRRIGRQGLTCGTKSSMDITCTYM